MADAWDYGPGNRDDSSSLSFADMLSQGSKALTDIVNAGNSVKRALNSSSVSDQGSAAPKSTGVPIWVWLIGAAVLYKAVKK